MAAIGKLERVALRQVWPNEASDFTFWLQENSDVLSEAIGIELNSIEREQAAGSFNVDLLAEDDAGKVVVIENQLERSDHDHLGKVLTYMVAMDASTAVWIVADPRPEHVAVIQWLNESTDGSFYMVKAEAVRIGDSEPAGLFTKIVGPSEEVRRTGETKRELKESEELRYAFWTEFLERAEGRLPSFASETPSYRRWLSIRTGISGVFLTLYVWEHRARAHLYISHGSIEESKAIFAELYKKKTDIEAAAGRSLVWKLDNGPRSCLISIPVDVGGYRDNNWKAVHEALIDGMARLERGLRPHLNELRARGLRTLSIQN